MPHPAWMGKLYLIAFPRPRSSSSLSGGIFYQKKRNVRPRNSSAPVGNPFPLVSDANIGVISGLTKHFHLFFQKNAFFLCFFFFIYIFRAFRARYPPSIHPPHRRAWMPSAVLHPTSDHPPHRRAWMPPPCCIRPAATHRTPRRPPGHICRRIRRTGGHVGCSEARGFLCESALFCQIRLLNVTDLSNLYAHKEISQPNSVRLTY